MGKVVKRIVLTGGPCAGKSSSLDLIQNYLINKGYIVYTVQESATELINSGIKPFGDNKLDLCKFQEVILKYQLDKEQLVEFVAKNYSTDKDIVIIYDRAIIDNKAYIGQSDFDKLLDKYNLNEIDILDKYDLVIHLETAAKTNYYTKENNKARSESELEAIELDTKTYDAWKLHKNLVRVKCFEKFEDKQSKILEICENNFSKNIRRQYKYVLDEKKCMLESLLDISNCVDITQYYLEFYDEYEHRVRVVKYKDSVKYFYTVQLKKDKGVSYIIYDNLIDENIYNMLVSTKTIKNRVNKIRYYFTYNEVQFHLDIFDDGKIILESNDDNFKINTLSIIKDVTADENYLNVNLISNFKQLKNTLV